MHLRQPQVTYIACGLFTKKNKTKQRKKLRNLKKQENIYL